MTALREETGGALPGAEVAKATESGVPVQRWGCVPAKDWPIRSEEPPWWVGDRELVEERFARQMDAEMAAWLDARAARYVTQHGISDEAAMDEARLDLLMWQKQRKRPMEALDRLREFEAAVAAY